MGAWKPDFNKVDFFDRFHLEKYLSICTEAVEIQQHIEQKPPAKDEYGHAIVRIALNDNEAKRNKWGNWLLERGFMVIYPHHFGESLVLDRFGCVYHRGQLLVYLPQYHQLRELSLLDWVNFDLACIELNEKLKQKFPDETFSKEMIGLFVVMAKRYKKEWDGKTFVDCPVEVEDKPSPEIKSSPEIKKKFVKYFIKNNWGEIKCLL